MASSANGDHGDVISASPGQDDQTAIADNQSNSQPEASALEQFAATARNQDDLERDIGREADRLLYEQATERDLKRLERTQAQKAKLMDQKAKLERRLRGPSNTTTSAAARINAEIEHLEPQIDSLTTAATQIQRRIDERKTEVAESSTRVDQGGNMRRPGESQRDFLIRTGKITPFSMISQGTGRVSANLAEVMLDAEEGEESDAVEAQSNVKLETGPNVMSHRNLLEPGFQDAGAGGSSEFDSEFYLDRPRKRRKTQQQREDAGRMEDIQRSAIAKPEDEFAPGDERSSSDEEGDSDFTIAEEIGGRTAGSKSRTAKRGKSSRKRDNSDTEESEDTSEDEDLAGLDDGNEGIYKSRLAKWTKGRREARREAFARNNDTHDASETSKTMDGDRDEWLMPHPTRPDAVLEGGIHVPGDIYPSLFDYQKTGVQWLSELYSQQVGGIVGDEMGLGKTIQVIAFLAALHHSNRLNQPVIIVTPATVMKQWVNEFHRWWPPLRVSILHTSGSGMMNLKSERLMEDDLEVDSYSWDPSSSRNSRSVHEIVNRVLKRGHVLVTTYAGLQSYAKVLLPVEWGYAVLDEGHKIRNPNAKITIFCKSLRTANRIILSGTPMQNNLTELWSLFDFIFPLRLGNLVSFRTQFEIPIKQGGYANASNLEVETALKCAETLKDAISPYLLQRFKVDVAADLPKKSEQVLFCRLTKIQRDEYERFLRSDDMTAILDGKHHTLFGIDILRKICNHPDLIDHRKLSVKPGYNYGNGAKSGKMQVVKELLQLWRDTGHKTLLFAQHRITLDILEPFIKALKGFHYYRMDGNTAIKDRQDMVDAFNNDPEIHVFLLTTKVGGLGVNLTGADRVIIFDPDWNPSTDMQARERSWRLGQKREVMIYRLMTAGTIEEKIYHRQIFKQFLTNKILRDPKQRQTFQLKDLHDLFTLGDADDTNTETGGLFKGTEVKFDDVAASNEDTQESSVPEHGPVDAANDSTAINSIVGISHRENFRNGESRNGTDRKIEPLNTGVDPSVTAKSTLPPVNNDSRILSSIFSRSGVHSALEHDAIMSGASKSKITADPVIIAAEARKVAAAAARELERAGEQAKNTPIGTLTWTGTVGSGGRPSNTPTLTRGGGGGFFSARGGRGGGPSSTSILANLSARQQGLSPNGSRSSTPADEQPRGVEFMNMIRNYITAHGGSVYTQMLIDHFNRFCKTPERTAEFKEMLRAIAVLDRGHSSNAMARASTRGGHFASVEDRSRGGRAKWVLKKQYGGTA